MWPLLTLFQRCPKFFSLTITRTTVFSFIPSLYMYITWMLRGLLNSVVLYKLVGRFYIGCCLIYIYLLYSVLFIQQNHSTVQKHTHTTSRLGEMLCQHPSVPSVLVPELKFSAEPRTPEGNGVRRGCWDAPSCPELEGPTFFKPFIIDL